RDRARDQMPPRLPGSSGEQKNNGIVIASAPHSRDIHTYTLAAMALFPVTFWWRMGYTESMFVCTAVLAMLGVARRWPVWVVALVIGLCSAVRPVGVALFLPLAWRIWKDGGKLVPSFKTLATLGWSGVLSCWGLLGFMLHLYLKFGEPLAFAAN